MHFFHKKIKSKYFNDEIVQGNVKNTQMAHEYNNIN